MPMALPLKSVTSQSSPSLRKRDLVADLVLHDVHLVARARLHEDQAVALVPRVGHLARLDVGQLDRLARLPGALDDVARRQVLDAAARERLALAGLDELVLDDGVRDAVDLDLQALADVGRLHGGAPR